MGQVFQLLIDKLTVRTVTRPGCWIEVVNAGKQPITSLCKLELDLNSPLTPRTLGFEQLPSTSAVRRMRQRPAQPGPADVTLALTDGVWWCSVHGHHEQYLIAKGDSLSIVTKAQAYCGLGAVELLRKMDLADAAIALLEGEFDFASVQVIAERERRAGLR